MKLIPDSLIFRVERIYDGSVASFRKLYGAPIISLMTATLLQLNSEATKSACLTSPRDTLSNRYTALHYAITSKSLVNTAAMIKLLLAHKAPLDAAKPGRTPLRLAIKEGRKETVELLGKESGASKLRVAILHR